MILNFEKSVDNAFFKVGCRFFAKNTPCGERVLPLAKHTFYSAFFALFLCPEAGGKELGYAE